MTRAALTVQDITRSGLVPSTAAAEATGNKFSNDGYTAFRITNGGGGDVVVTLSSYLDSQTVSQKTVTVAAGATEYIGPFPVSPYNQSDGMVYVDYDGVASVTVVALRIRPNT